MIDNGSVLVSKCENALKGTALLMVELVVLAEFTVAVELDANTLAGAESVLAEGVYSADPVSALESAEVDPTEDEDEAAAPLVPVEVPLWI